MRTKVRVAAMFLSLAVVVFWLFGGPNFGWTKTSVPHQQKEPVTEIEYTTYEKKFVPGIDFLAAGLFAAGVLAGGSFFIQRAPGAG